MMLSAALFTAILAPPPTSFRYCRYATSLLKITLLMLLSAFLSCFLLFFAP